MLLWFKALRHSMTMYWFWWCCLLLRGWKCWKLHSSLSIDFDDNEILMIREWQFQEVFHVGHTHPNLGLFRTEHPRSLSSVGYFLVSSILWALRVSKFLLLVLAFPPPVLLGSWYLFWLSGLNVTMFFLTALPKFYFLWCLTPSTISPLLSCEASAQSFLFALSPWLFWLNLYDPVWLPLCFQWIYLLSKPLQFFFCSRNRLPFNMYVSCTSFMPIWEHCIYCTWIALKPWQPVHKTPSCCSSFQ